LKKKGAANKRCFCSVFLLLNKTPKKEPLKSAAIAEGGVQKKWFLWFVFLRLNKTGFIFSTALTQYR
jgi:hypothetical protein